jgi:hypothetical protein
VKLLQALIAGLVLSLTGSLYAGGTASDPGTQSESPMIGELYDLKQTPDHQPTGMDFNTFFKVVDEFLSKDWDESVLNHYYRVSKPLYTTQIYIPEMSSELALAAYGVDKEVKPILWLIHYKAQVSPPEDGTYRLVGSGDDVLAVAVNEKTVLAAPLHNPDFSLLPKTGWKPTEPGGMEGDLYGKMINGDWIPMKKNEVYDLDVIFGDCPGGLFSAFLTVEKQGGNYKRDKDHHAILPIFQVAPYNTPPHGNPREAPPFSTGFPIWKCYQ